MTKRQVIDLEEELTSISENLATILNGVEFDDRNLVKPLVKINNELAAFIGKLQELTLESN